MMQANQQCRVLLVDDDKFIREIVEMMLKTLGYGVACAVDGPDALKIFQDGEGVHIVMTDILMPEMDGWQLAHQIKSIKPTIPIVAITGLGPERVISRLDMKGIDYAIFKPMNMNQLKDTLQDIVDKTPLNCSIGSAEYSKELN